MSHTTRQDYDPEALAKSFQMIGLDYAAASPTNPRKHFDPVALAELTESIRKRGVLQPILCRIWPLSYEQPAPLTTYEIIAGERRWRAAKAAGLTMIEAKVVEMSDAEVVEIQIIENLQREDLHPLEEAEGYSRLMTEHGYTAEHLAETISKSRSYIFGRLKLLALDDDARRLFVAGKLNPSTALLVARIPTTALRAKAIAEITAPDYNLDTMSVRAAHRHIKSRYMLELGKAPFPIDDATLTKAGTCTTCPQRTGNAPDIFEDVDSPDVCTNPDCFVEKKIAFRDREAAKVKAAGGTVIIGDEAKKITGGHSVESHSTLKHYTPLDKTCYDDPEKRTFAEILGEAADPVMLEDTVKQTLVPVIDNKVLAEKLQAAGVKLRAEEESKDQAKVDAKIKIERTTRQRMFSMVRENIADITQDDGGFAYGVQAHLFKCMVIRLWDRLYQGIQPNIANLWGANGKNNTERVQNFALLIPSMSTEECWLLATDILLMSSTHVTNEWDLDHPCKQLSEVAAYFDIDHGETSKAVQAELKAKEQEAKPARKTPKKEAKTTPPATTAEALPPLKAAQAGDSDREKAAQASETSARKTGTAKAKSETPPAGAGLIEMDEKQSPSEEPGYKAGDYIKVKMTAKNWRCAGQEAVITEVVEAGKSYKVKYGPLSMESAGVSESEIDGRLPGGKKPAWLKEEQSSTSDEANEKAPTGQPFAIGDQVRVRMDAGREGYKLSARGLIGEIMELHYDGAIVVELTYADGDTGQEVFTADDLEFIPEPEQKRCDKTIDMFQGAAA